MTDIAFSSARRLAGTIRRGRIGSLELLERYLARVERFNPRLNAIIETDIPAARRRARAADRGALPRRALGPAPRRADHGQGLVRREGHADHLGRAGIQGLASRTGTRSRSTGCSRPARCCSARPTCRSGSPTRRPSTPSMDGRSARGARTSRRAAPRAAPRPRWRRGSPGSSSAPTSRPRSARRRRSAGCSGTSRPSESAPPAAIRSGATSRRSTSWSSARWRARRRISRCRSR